jgi:hypothetical protein
MPKLFLFCIGGTGNRVLKSLTNLLASGVALQNTDCIVPIIIDPDTANADLTRTIEQIREYRRIHNLASSDKSIFFRTKISSLDELGDGNLAADTFRFDIQGVQNQKFEDFINYAGLSRTNKAFTSLLFSEDNLKADMEVGFKGNPNIGSVVINKLKDSEFYTKFAQNFADGDRIFIVSSIFGGTGAAGFPLILKNIRTAGANVPNHHFLQNAPIGAITMLPYFGVDTTIGSTVINSDTFISKAKAALQYYNKNVTGNNSINALYYIGDNTTNLQRGSDGGPTQENGAHFLEMAAALSVVDFMGKDNASLQVQKAKVVAPTYFEFANNRESTSVTFQDLCTETKDIISAPSVQFSLLSAFVKYHYNTFGAKANEAWASDGTNKLSVAVLNTNFISDLKSFIDRYLQWLEEMRSSQVSFNAIAIRTEADNMYNLVNGANNTTGFLARLLKGAGLTHFRTKLSEGHAKFDTLTSPKKYLALLSSTTEFVYNEKINI